MPSAKHAARCAILYVKRGFSEDKRSTLFSIILSIVLTAAIVPRLAKGISAIPPQGLTYVGNLYALTFGATIGFLASVITSGMGSVLYHDKVSRFVEVILSTPLTPRTYIASITTASIIHSIASYAIVASVYTAVSATIASDTAKQVLLNSWVYIIALLMAILTSLISVTVNLVAARLSVDPSRLATIPSMAIFLVVIFVISSLGIKALSNEYLYAFTAALGMACLALVIAIETLARRLAGEYLITW